MPLFTNLSNVLSLVKDFLMFCQPKSKISGFLQIKAEVGEALLRRPVWDSYTGQPSVDPIVLFKMMLIGYFFRLWHKSPKRCVLIKSMVV